VLAANLEMAINGLWDAAPRVGDRIAVIGGGTLGCLVAWLAARMPGCRVELIDTNPRRAPIALALGPAFADPGAATPQADLVIHASGSPAGLALGLGLAGFEATVLELSWYGTLGEPCDCSRRGNNKSAMATPSDLPSCTSSSWRPGKGWGR
jgi:threonine dehydrogenase-like Zn-dependent dehydrogenase